MKKSLFGVSMLTITCLYGILAGVVILVTLVAGGNVLYAILGSLIVLIIQFLISPWLTDLSMRWFYKAKFGGEIPEYLKKFIEEECKKHKVKYPKIGIIDDGAPNAFTYGRCKRDARIVITRGIFELLKEDEVKAVVAHEIGHIVHRDMLVMTAVQIVPLVLYAIYEMFAYSSNSSDNNSDSGNAQIIGWIAFVLYIICQYIILWLSRTREYYADSFACSETKKPNSLAEALVKIGFGLSTSTPQGKHNVSKNNTLGIFDVKAGKALSVAAMDENGGVSKTRIKNAMKWEMWNPWAKWFEFNSTHPMISKRIEAISKISKDYGQEPYIVFDLKKPESYVDDFLVELVIFLVPKLFLIGGIVFGFIAISNDNKQLFIYAGICALLMIITSFVKFRRAHRDGYTERDVASLLGEVKVSHVTSIPCELKGTIIGRGNPGCIFSEDFVIKDNTGIIFLDYNQPLTIINKIFALFKSKEYFDKEVLVKGWYRRNPVPYVEIYSYTVNGKTKKIYTYGLSLILYVIGLLASIGLMFYGFM